MAAANGVPAGDCSAVGWEGKDTVSTDQLAASVAASSNHRPPADATNSGEQRPPTGAACSVGSTFSQGVLGKAQGAHIHLACTPYKSPMSAPQLAFFQPELLQPELLLLFMFPVHFEY